MYYIINKFTIYIFQYLHIFIKILIKSYIVYYISFSLLFIFPTTHMDCLRVINLVLSSLTIYSKYIIVIYIIYNRTL